MNPYPSEVCKHMKAFYDSLSEKDRRRYAAVEAEKLGHGGVEYIASVFWVAPRKRYVRDVATWSNCRRMKPKDESEKKGGRKKASVACPGLEENLRQVVADHTAGDPMREDVVWTYLSSTEIADNSNAWERRSVPIPYAACLKNSAFTNVKPKRPRRWATPLFATSNSRTSPN